MAYFRLCPRPADGIVDTRNSEEQTPDQELVKEGKRRQSSILFVVAANNPAKDDPDGRKHKQKRYRIRDHNCLLSPCSRYLPQISSRRHCQNSNHHPRYLLNHFAPYDHPIHGSVPSVHDRSYERDNFRLNGIRRPCIANPIRGSSSSSDLPHAYVLSSPPACG